MAKTFFGLHLNLGAKFRTEIEILSLTKLRKNILPLRNLLNQQKIDAYAVNMTISYDFHILYKLIFYNCRAQRKKKTAFGNFDRSRVFICRNTPDMFFNANAEKKAKCMQSNNKCISTACANTRDR